MIFLKQLMQSAKSRESLSRLLEAVAISLLSIVSIRSAGESKLAGRRPSHLLLIVRKRTSHVWTIFEDFRIAGAKDKSKRPRCRNIRRVIKRQAADNRLLQDNRPRRFFTNHQHSYRLTQNLLRFLLRHFTRANLSFQHVSKFRFDQTRRIPGRKIPPQISRIVLEFLFANEKVSQHTTVDEYRVRNHDAIVGGIAAMSSWTLACSQLNFFIESKELWRQRFFS